MSENFWEADPIAADTAAQKSPTSGGDFWSKDPIALDQVADRQGGTPQQKTWGETVTAPISRTLDKIKGKQDPAYANVPAFDTTPDSTQSGIQTPLLGAMLAGSGRDAYGDIIQKALGDRFVRKYQDTNGYHLIDYKDTNGQPKTAYVEKPGLDASDVMRGFVGAVPYVVGGLGAAGVKIGGAALKSAPWLYRSAVHSGIAGSTNVAGQVAQHGLGSEQDFDKTQAALATVLGGAGEVIPSKALAPIAGGTLAAAATYDADNGMSYGGTAAGTAAGVAAAALARRMLKMNPSAWMNGETGQLTPRAVEVAKASGVDVNQLTGQMAKSWSETMAATRDATQAANAVETRSGIPMSLGERTKDYQQLVKEDQWAAGLKGSEAKTVIDKHRADQAQAVSDAAYGGIKVPVQGPPTMPPAPGAAPPPPVMQTLRPGVGETINPLNGRALPPSDALQSLGENVQPALQAAREGGRQVERNAWKDVGDIKATPEALASLPKAISDGTADKIISEKNTPAAAKMVDLVRSFHKGEAPAAGDEFVSNRAFQNVNEVRKALGSMTQDAVTPTDKSAASAVYKSFNDWTQAAGDAGHLPVEQVSAMRAARPISAEVKSIFNPRLPDGRPAPASNIIQKALQGDSPEGVINSLVGNPTAQIPAGKVQALLNIKTALERYSPTPAAGQQAVADLKLAHWNKIMLDKGGKINSYDMIANNIERAFSNQKSVIDVLYTPQEQQLIRQLGTETRRISTRELAPRFRTNASGSAFAGMAAVKDLIDGAFKAFGASKSMQSAVGIVRGLPGAKNLTESIRDNVNSAAAKQAVSQIPKEEIPAFGPYAAGAYGGTHNAFDDRR